MNRKRLRTIIIAGIITTICVLLVSFGLILIQCCNHPPLIPTQLTADLMFVHNEPVETLVVQTQTAAYSIELTLTQAITSTPTATP